MKQLAMWIGLNVVTWAPVVLIVWAVFVGNEMANVP